jgi:hypothetical protein
MYSLSMPKTYHSAAINDKLRAALWMFPDEYKKTVNKLLVQVKIRINARQIFYVNSSFWEYMISKTYWLKFTCRHEKRYKHEEKNVFG